MADALQNRRPHPLLVALAVVGVLTLTAVLFVLVTVGWALKSVPEFARSGFHTSAKTHTEKFIAGIKLDGEINSHTADTVVEKLESALKDSETVGVLLEVNSPGGSVVASQEIYDTVKRVKVKKPVVAYVREMAASGAYYSSASASKIVANRGSLVGSIGVILSTVEVSKLIDWLKLKPVTLKTGKLKDSGSPTREWTEDDKSYLQALINDTRGQFIGDVRAERNLTDAAANEMSDGRVVLAPHALSLKLIDAVGAKQVALQEIATIANLKDIPELEYLEDKKEFPDFIGNLLRSEKTNLRQEIEQTLTSSVATPQIKLK